MKMGDRLKQLRIQRSLSQEAVARTIGITRSAYSHYEINNRQPVYNTLIKLAAFFSVTIDYIIEGEPQDSSLGVTAETNEIMRLLSSMDQDKRRESISKMLHLIKETE